MSEYIAIPVRPPRLLERIGAVPFVRFEDNDRAFDYTEHCCVHVGTVWHATNSTTPIVEIVGRARAELMDQFSQENRLDNYYQLVKFVTSARKRSCTRFSHWRWYHHKYVAIAGPLYQGGVISSMEYHGFFWMGIPLFIREQLKRQLWTMVPQHNRNQPHHIQNVNAAARQYFEGVAAEDDGDGDDDARSDSLMSLALSDE